MTREKKFIAAGIGLFIAVGLVVTYLVKGLPGHDMAKLADEFCACTTDACRQEVGQKILSLEQAHVGKTHSPTEVRMWDEAQRKVARCLEGSPPAPPAE